MKLSSIWTFCLLLCFSSGAFAQNLLDDFKIAQVDKEIRLDFTIKAGISCVDLEIERSDDGVLFDVIGFIPGICGEPTEASSYSFFDKSPLINQTAYYRLFLRTNGYSSIVNIMFLDPGESGILIYPNPFQYNLNILTDSKNIGNYSLSIYDNSGRIVSQLSGKGNKIAFNSEINLSPGTYRLLIMYDKGKSYSAVIIKN